MLNSYNPKAAEGLQTISRIKQMRGVADSFSGSLDIYVAKGNVVEHAIASTANFFSLGKQTSAIWATNPYRHVAGGLGTLMTILATIRNTVSVVGSLCTKIGMVLTLVGLLGMIFPPIGTAVEGIARVLNVVGLICDSVALALSGVLTGLNAVVLAQQIAAGASAEEMAATADLMLDESNQTASGLSSLALSFGTGFVNGLQKASKGVANSLFRQFKTRIGKISFGVGASFKKVASSIFGAGGESALLRLGGKWQQAGVMGKLGRGAGVAWHAPGRMVGWLRTNSMKRFGTSKLARGLDAVGARSGAFASHMESATFTGAAKIYGEKAGSAAMNAGAETSYGAKLAATTDEMESRFRQFKAKSELQGAALEEKQNWKGFLAQRDNQLGRTEKTEFNEQFAQKRFNQTVQAGENKIANNEVHLARQDRREGMWERRMANDRAQFQNDPEFRTRFLNNVDQSRVNVQSLEESLATQQQRRAELLVREEKVGLSQSEKAELTQAQIALHPLDLARSQNEVAERRLKGLSSGDKHEIPKVDHWGDLWSQTETMRDLQGELAETSTDQQLKQAGQANVGHQKEVQRYDALPLSSSSPGANFGRGIPFSLGNYQPPAADAFNGFSRRQLQISSVGASTRSLLSRIGKPKTAAQPSSSTPAAANGNAAAAVGAIEVATAAGTASSVGAGAANTVGSQPAEVASVTTASANVDVLPYWPALLEQLASVTGDFNYMRTSGHDFLKAQIKARQTSVDALAAFGRYDEYAKARAKAAEQHKAETATTPANANENATHSATASDRASAGESQQSDARGQVSGSANAQLPEPKATGFWGRLILPIKRWATEKAAAVFGWIQEKVANLVLQGLCGVSFTDLKNYSEALRRSQRASATTAEGAQQNSATVHEHSIQLASDASSRAQFAADSIGECDHNIDEAEHFLTDIDTFEQQVAAQKIEAENFLAALRVELTTTRDRRLIEDGKLETPRLQSSVDNDGDAFGDAMRDRTELPLNADRQPYDDVNDHDASQADRQLLVSAAALVRDNADVLNQQLTDRHDNYLARLSSDVSMSPATPVTAAFVTNGMIAADQVVSIFSAQTATVHGQMVAEIMLAGSQSDLTHQAIAIMQAGDMLDHDFLEAQRSLDSAFEETYSVMNMMSPSSMPSPGLVHPVEMAVSDSTSSSPVGH